MPVLLSGSSEAAYHVLQRFPISPSIQHLYLRQSRYDVQIFPVIPQGWPVLARRSCALRPGCSAGGPPQPAS